VGACGRRGPSSRVAKLLESIMAPLGCLFRQWRRSLSTLTHEIPGANYEASWE
jgi:hypothetical protein